MGKKGQTRELSLLLDHYVKRHGEAGTTLHDAAQWMLNQGYPEPKAKSSVDILAERLAKLARNQTEFDPDSGTSYRKYHAVPDDTQPGLFKWFDIRDAPRSKMNNSLRDRRKQMVNDGVQLTLDLIFWNKCHPDEEPLEALEMNLTEDIAERLALFDIAPLN